MGMGFRGCEALGCLVFSHPRDLVVSFSICNLILLIYLNILLWYFGAFVLAFWFQIPEMS